MIADDIVKFTFSGDSSDPIKRHITGLYSFDRAFEPAGGQLGMPLGTGYEVYGAPSTGKSTWSHSMAGIIAGQLSTNIHISDLEGFDAGHLANILSYLKYKGDVHLGHQGKDEKILGDFADVFLGRAGLELKYGIGVLDSIAAISPVAEKEGDFGSANYGRRAVLMGMLSRRLLPTIHPRTIGSENVYFLTNHWYPKIGGTKYQYESPGGNVKNYLCGIRIHLKRNGKPFDDNSYRLIGRPDKNRYGITKKQFTVFVKAGIGIHPGLTAMFECIDLNLATSGKSVKIGDKSFGFRKKIIEKEWQDDEFFQPFYAVLKENEND